MMKRFISFALLIFVCFSLFSGVLTFFHGQNKTTGGGGFTNTYSFDFKKTANQYIDIKNASNFHFESGGTDSAFSMSAWVQMDDATNFRIMFKGASSNRELVFGIGSDDKLYFILYTNASNYIGLFSDATYTAYKGTWVHFAVTYDGSESSSGMNMYFNGSVISAFTDISTGTHTAINNSGSDLLIGLWSGASPLAADGRMDEISVWDAELTSTDISNIYNSGSPDDLSSHAKSANLILWVRADGDGTGADGVIDHSGSLNHGTMTNMVAGDIVADVP